ncbi:uncharacterized protein LOC116040573 isoform X2 [Sander lucioperca]|uniref:uncharacterized protein LOC116040571 n=1 Tax=Sander lucioperca TaxID=283035 RepID=UPI00125D940B|nr:uncharacterized protein LOC116040571 [Sander lucioperca]XP_031141907.1 uncharacterized protein LOC116040572 isoform X1 [Sander lucioperca]XP_031141909.1 uncharacterized protein LOC116040573 isoform X1 [Sander lucioperca]XP_031141910.1 uncharacterized protein LOC116040573 isoform X2 [Sander lucioperca]
MWRAMMNFIHVAVAVLSLLSIGQSAPVSSCESLIKPIEINGTEKLLGKWTYIAESTTIPASKLLTKMFVDSARVKITAAEESDAINVFQSHKMFGRCFTLTTKMTLENSTLSIVQPFNSSEVLLTTGCPDCRAAYIKLGIGGRTYSGLQLLSRRNKVTAAELEEFTKQVECLNLPAPAILDPEKGFCPDESHSQETEVVDLTNIMNDLGSEVFSHLDRIINSEGGMQALFKMISNGLAGLKEN